MLNNHIWYKDAVFYEVYVRAFSDSSDDGHGDLVGLTQKLDYLLDLGVDCLWLLPVYPSPLKDDGYDIADFYGVLPRYGTLTDYKNLIEAAHQRGMHVVSDLVLNHTSDQHPWFQKARADRNSKYRDYYVWSDSNQKYSQARIIFLDTEESNWTWDEMAGQYYWHRFYSSQPDLNFDNPAVQSEIIKIMRFWLELGIDGFRVDAVPYLFEREGTNCENLPETHAFLKELRQFMNENYPGRILLCEANQWPVDVRKYFGEGDEFHMGFHFPIMPRIFMALRKERVLPLVEIEERTPAIPDNCQWCIFLRNHDELTLEMVTEDQRQWMWQEYAPEKRMRLNLGIRRRLAPLLDNDPKKIKLAYSLLFSLPGSPVIYYGDEIGMGDNIWLPDRNGVRTPMQWDMKKNAGFSNADPEKIFSPIITDDAFSPAKVNVESQQKDRKSLLNIVRRMIKVRKDHSLFGRGDFRWANCSSQSIAAYYRSFQGKDMLIVNNLSSASQKVNIEASDQKNSIPVDILTGNSYPQNNIDKYLFNLYPYQYLWLVV